MKENIKTEWDLTQFYKSVDDPEIDKDVKKVDATFSKFEKKYKKFDFLKNDNTLFEALHEYEKISGMPISKPLLYLSYAQTLNQNDAIIRAKLNLITQQFTKSANKLVFFDVRLSKIDKKKQA